MKFLFFSLTGRISRKWWWIGQIILILIGLALAGLLEWLIGGVPFDFWRTTIPPASAALVDAIIFVVLLRPYLAMDIKRIHDRHNSAWLLVPSYLGYLVVLATYQQFDKLFEPDQGLIGVVYGGFVIIWVIYSVALFIMLGFLKGTNGASKYGPDPLASTNAPLDEAI